MSWKPEVKVEGEWSRNGLAFATEDEAKRSAFDLMGRWFLVEDYRAVHSNQPVNYKHVDGKDIPIEETA
jgi:hypothetical protein